MKIIEPSFQWLNGEPDGAAIIESLARAVFPFGNGTGVRVVLQTDGSVKTLLKDLYDGDIIPVGKVRRALDQAFFTVERAAAADPDGVYPAYAVSPEKRFGTFGQFLEDRLPAPRLIGRKGDLILYLFVYGDVFAAHSEDGGAFCSADIYAEIEGFFHHFSSFSSLSGAIKRLLPIRSGLSAMAGIRTDIFRSGGSWIFDIVSIAASR